MSAQNARQFFRDMCRRPAVHKVPRSRPFPPGLVQRPCPVCAAATRLNISCLLLRAPLPSVGPCAIVIPVGKLAPQARHEKHLGFWYDGLGLGGEVTLLLGTVCWQWEKRWVSKGNMMVFKWVRTSVLSGNGLPSLPPTLPSPLSPQATCLNRGVRRRLLTEVRACYRAGTADPMLTFGDSPSDLVSHPTRSHSPRCSCQVGTARLPPLPLALAACS